MFEDVQAPGPMKAVFSVLFALASAGPSGISVRELAGRADLPDRVVYRHLATLKSLGLAEGTDVHGRVRVGAAAAALASRSAGQQDFLRYGQSAVDSLTEQIREPVHVTIFDHGTSATIVAASEDVVRTSDVVPIVVGSRRPAHASASGKLFLAHSRNALEAYLLRPLTAFTAHTLTEPDALRAECGRILERGYSTEVQENLLGISCVAVPVSAVRGRVTAALVVSTKRAALPAGREAELVRAMSAVAEKLGMEWRGEAEASGHGQHRQGVA